MFRRIEAQMILVGINKKQLAEILGMRYNTLLLKLSGSSLFTLDEAIKIKEAIKAEEPIEKLFERVA